MYAGVVMIVPVVAAIVAFVIIGMEDAVEFSVCNFALAVNSG